MALTPYSGDTSVIGKLGTTPQERGLTTQQFKDKFDEAFKKFIEEYFNTTHLDEIDAHMANSAAHIKESVINLVDLSANNVYKVDILSQHNFNNFLIWRDINLNGTNYGGMHLKVISVDEYWGNYQPFYDIAYSWNASKNLKKIVGSGIGPISLYLRGGRMYYVMEFNKISSITINTNIYETYDANECMSQGFYKGLTSPNITADTTPYID